MASRAHHTGFLHFIPLCCVASAWVHHLACSLRGSTCRVLQPLFDSSVHSLLFSVASSSQHSLGNLEGTNSGSRSSDGLRWDGGGAGAAAAVSSVATATSNSSTAPSPPQSASHMAGRGSPECPDALARLAVHQVQQALGQSRGSLGERVPVPFQCSPIHDQSASGVQSPSVRSKPCSPWTTREGGPEIDHVSLPHHARVSVRVSSRLESAPTTQVTSPSFLLPLDIFFPPEQNQHHSNPKHWPFLAS